MTQWSDGKIRSPQYQGTDLQVALREYFAVALEEERLTLKWDNEAMRVKLAGDEHPLAVAVGR